MANLKETFQKAMEDTTDFVASADFLNEVWFNSMSMGGWSFKKGGKPIDTGSGAYENLWDVPTKLIIDDWLQIQFKIDYYSKKDKKYYSQEHDSSRRYRDHIDEAYYLHVTVSAMAFNPATNRLQEIIGHNYIGGGPGYVDYTDYSFSSQPLQTGFYHELCIADETIMRKYFPMKAAGTIWQAAVYPCYNTLAVDYSNFDAASGKNSTLLTRAKLDAYYPEDNPFRNDDPVLLGIGGNNVRIREIAEIFLGAAGYPTGYKMNTQLSRPFYDNWSDATLKPNIDKIADIIELAAQSFDMFNEISNDTLTSKKEWDFVGAANWVHHEDSYLPNRDLYNSDKSNTLYARTDIKNWKLDAWSWAAVEDKEDEYVFNSFCYQLGRKFIDAKDEVLVEADLLYIIPNAPDTTVYSYLSGDASRIADIVAAKDHIALVKLTVSFKGQPHSFVGYSLLDNKATINLARGWVAHSPILTAQIEELPYDFGSVMPALLPNYSLFCDGECEDIKPIHKLSYDFKKMSPAPLVVSNNKDDGEALIAEDGLWVSTESFTSINGNDVEITKVFSEFGQVTQASDYGKDNLTVVEEELEYLGIYSNWYATYQDKILLPLEANGNLAGGIEIPDDQLFLELIDLDVDVDIPDNPTYPIELTFLGQTVLLYDEASFKIKYGELSWHTPYQFPDYQTTVTANDGGVWVKGQLPLTGFENQTFVMGCPAFENAYLNIMNTKKLQELSEYDEETIDGILYKYKDDGNGIRHYFVSIFQSLGLSGLAGGGLEDLISAGITMLLKNKSTWVEVIGMDDLSDVGSLDFPMHFTLLGQAVTLHNETSFPHANVAWTDCYATDGIDLDYCITNNDVWVRGQLINVAGFEDITVILSLPVANGVAFNVMNPKNLTEEAIRWADDVVMDGILYKMSEADDGTIHYFALVKQIYTMFGLNGLGNIVSDSIETEMKPNFWVEAIGLDTTQANTGCLTQEEFTVPYTEDIKLAGYDGEIYLRNGVYYAQSNSFDDDGYNLPFVYCPLDLTAADVEGEEPDELLFGSRINIGRCMTSIDFENLLAEASFVSDEYSLADGSYFQYLDSTCYYVQESGKVCVVTTPLTDGYDKNEFFVQFGAYKDTDVDGAFLDATGRQSPWIRTLVQYGQRYSQIFIFDETDKRFYIFKQQQLSCENPTIYDKAFIAKYGAIETEFPKSFMSIDGENVPVYESTTGLKFIKPATDSDVAAGVIYYCPIELDYDDGGDDKCDCCEDACCWEVEKTKVYYISDEASGGSLNIPFAVKLRQKHCWAEESEEVVNYECEDVQVAIMELLEDMQEQAGVAGLGRDCAVDPDCDKIHCEYLDAGTVTLYIVDKCKDTASCRPFNVVVTDVECKFPDQPLEVIQLTCEEIDAIIRSSNIGLEGLARCANSMSGLGVIDKYDRLKTLRSQLTAKQMDMFTRVANKNLDAITAVAKDEVRAGGLNEVQTVNGLGDTCDDCAAKMECRSVTSPLNYFIARIQGNGTVNIPLNVTRTTCTQNNIPTSVTYECDDADNPELADIANAYVEANTAVLVPILDGLGADTPLPDYVLSTGDVTCISEVVQIWIVDDPAIDNAGTEPVAFPVMQEQIICDDAYTFEEVSCADIAAAFASGGINGLSFAGAYEMKTLDKQTQKQNLLSAIRIGKNLINDGVLNK